jgi:hypothetical protein
MLKVSKQLRLPVAVTMALTVVAFAALVSAGSALAHGGNHGHNNEESPPTLNGDWASFNRCPVDNPTMLAATGEATVALCLSVASPNGSLKIGNLTAPTKGTDLQIGLVEDGEGSLGVVAPENGAVLDESIEVPNGLQGLICPAHGRLAWQVCRKHHDGRGNRDNEDSSELNNVTLSIVSAGEPSNFNLGAGLQLNLPLISLPVKLHLQNRLLGENCYIGSDAEPIVIQPENTTAPEAAFEAFDGNGTPDPSGPMILIKINNSQGSSSFTVPAASGCGFQGIFDDAINRNVGLPSPAGSNNVVFNESATGITALSSPESIVPNDGKELSKNWHSAVQPEEQEEGRHHHHGHGH